MVGSDGKKRGSKRPSPDTIITIDLTLSDSDGNDSDSGLDGIRTSLNKTKFSGIKNVTSKAASTRNVSTSSDDDDDSVIIVPPTEVRKRDASPRSNKRPKFGHGQLESKPAAAMTIGSTNDDASSSKEGPSRKVTPPKSAYTCFYESRRSSILRKKPGKSTLRRREVRRIEAQFSQLSKSEKSKWERQAADDKKRYEAEISLSDSSTATTGNSSTQASTSASTNASSTISSATNVVKQEKSKMASEKSIEDIIDIDDKVGGKNHSASNLGTIDDEDIEVVDRQAPSFVPATAGESDDGPTSSTRGNEEDDIVLMGATNSLRLPHSRNNCTEKVFSSSNAASGSKFFSSDIIATNAKCCDLW